jgi:hypothetical protein
MIVHDDDVVVVDDEGGVADDGERAGADSVIHTFLDLVESERLAAVRRPCGLA